MDLILNNWVLFLGIGLNILAMVACRWLILWHRWQGCLIAAGIILIPWLFFIITGAAYLIWKGIRFKARLSWEQRRL